MKRFFLLALGLGLVVAAAVATDFVFDQPGLTPQKEDSDYVLARRQAAAIGNMASRTNGIRSASVVTGQQALSTAASLVLAANTARQSILIDNHDPAISIYVGPSGVTTTTGKLVRAGQAITIRSTAAIYAIAASGTPTISYLAEND